MKTKPFVAGLCLGAVLGALAAIGAYKALQDPPVSLTLHGTVQFDSSTHRDSYLDNSAYLDAPVLEGWIYLTSEAIDINELHRLSGKTVSLSGRARTIPLEHEGPVLELDVTDVRQEPASR